MLTPATVAGERARRWGPHISCWQVLRDASSPAQYITHHQSSLSASVSDIFSSAHWVKKKKEKCLSFKWDMILKTIKVSPTLCMCPLGDLIPLHLNNCKAKEKPRTGSLF